MHLKNAVKIEIHDSGQGVCQDLLMVLIAMTMGSVSILCCTSSLSKLTDFSYVMEAVIHASFHWMLNV